MSGGYGTEASDDLGPAAAGSIDGITLWDGRRALGPTRISWQGDRIEAVEQADDRHEGLAVIPGLVDTHVHLDTSVLDGAGPGDAWPLVTPDEEYYVGLDMHSAIHPQTLLCYEINGQPLSLAHGAPLRLVTPLKYGIKHLKRIGTIAFADQRPADYWAEQGYDWDAGH